jgi:enoyl-CoA hydratase/carnithine racemase
MKEPVMSYETIRFDVEDRIATITLNRPERMNAFVWQMGAELMDAYARCDEDDEVRVVILTGAGKAFCAGADMARGERTFREAPPDRVEGSGGAERAGEGPREVRACQLRKPVIAAINGHAIGVGITLAMQCDVRYVAEDAKLAFAFVRRGVIPGLGSHSIVPRVVGLSSAAELMLSGRQFSGGEAEALGLASKALPTKEVLPAARDLARDIAVNTAPVSVAISKRLLWEGITHSVPEMMAKEDALFAYVAQQPDALEGVMAFVEKREPEWKLRIGRDLPEWPSDDPAGGAHSR